MTDESAKPGSGRRRRGRERRRGQKKPADDTPPPPHHEEGVVETAHVATVGGVEIAYTATAGRTILREEEGKKKASFFSVAYTRDGVEDPATRPIVFCFNGGPGSSSVWLHLGAFGPRRVLLDENGMPGPPPGKACRQRARAPRRRRHRLHRPGRHGLLARHPGRGAEAVHALQARHRDGRRVHPHLPDAPPTLELAEVPRG